METLNRLEKILDVPAKAKEHILAELRSHLDDAREELIETGATPEQAEGAAAARLGPPDELAGDFLAIYGPGWKTFLLILAPFFVALLSAFDRNTSQLIGRFPFRDFGNWTRFAQTMDALLMIVCLVVLGGIVWGLVKPRKPAWLSSWLVGSFLSFFWLPERLRTEFGVTLGLYSWWLSFVLQPATLNLWLYRAKSRARPWVLGIWVILLLDMLFSPRSFRAPVAAGIIAVQVFKSLLCSSAWILLAAKLSPRGRGNWAIYSSLSIFVYMMSPGWFNWALSSAFGSSASFWVSATVGPIAIWVLLYSRRIWMKIGVLASGVAVFRVASHWPYLGIMDASSAAWTVLQLVLSLAIVTAPLLLWQRLENKAGDLQVAAR